MGHPGEPLSSFVCEALSQALLLRALRGVWYMFGGSQPYEDLKMWHVGSRSLATPGKIRSDTGLHSYSWTASRFMLAPFSPARSTSPASTQFPTLIHVHKLSTEVMRKWNRNDIDLSILSKSHSLKDLEFCTGDWEEGRKKEWKSLNNWIAINWFFSGSWWYFTV